MKAIRVEMWGGPEVLTLRDVDDPVAGENQVVVNVAAVGVNPVDTYIRSGNHGKDRPIPYTPGTDASGTVESVGNNVTDFRVGDRVYTSTTVTGAYAEKTVAAVENVYRLPENITFEQGAAIHVPYATAFRALFQRARAVAGETVFVHGASGGVGIASVQLAKAYGLKVVGTVGTASGIELVKAQGADLVVDHTEEDYSKAVMSFTNGKGFDVILEMLANINLAKDLSLLAFGGRVVVIGNRGSVEINPRELMGRDAAILGMSLFNAAPSDIKTIHAALFAGLENGTLKPVVGRKLPLAEAYKAHIAIMEPGAHGKIVLIP